MSLDPDDPVPDGDSDDVGGGQISIGAIGAIAAAAYVQSDQYSLPWQTPVFRTPPATITTIDGNGNPIILTLIDHKFNTTGSEAGTQQYVAYATPDNSQIVIGVEGTWNGTNLGVDLATWSPTSSTPSAGFLNYLKDTAAFVAAVEAAHPGAQVSITGHSLGGSVAQVIGYYMNLPATAIYAPGVGGFITGSAVSNVLNGYIPSGYTPATDDVVNTDIHRPGELLSGAGTPFGTQFILQSTDPASPINAGDHWWTNDHSLNDVLPILNSISSGSTTSSIVPYTTPNPAPYLGLPINLLPDYGSGASAIFSDAIASGYLNIGDPPPGNRFVLTFGAGSLRMDKLLLPDDGQGLAAFKIWTETGGVWSPVTTYKLGTPVSVAASAQAIEIEAFDSGGNIVTLPSNWEFYATFLSNGSFNGTVTGYTDAASSYVAAIQADYDTYFGRDPTAYEASYWAGLIADSGDLAAFRTALLKDPAGQAHTNAQIKILYDTYFGRDPQASELSAWQGLIASGYDFNALRSALLNDPTGQAHTNAQIKLLYDAYFGRDPQPSELAAWQSLIASGYDFNGLRTALLKDPGSATAAQIITLYDTYFGRDPSDAEVLVWQRSIGGSGNFSGLRAALLSDPSGVAHTNAQIQLLYDTYFGRDPQASEYAAWQGLIAKGYDFTGLRTALLNDPTGVAHTNAQIKLLYDTYFGRDPQASEYAAWQALIKSGYDFNGLRAALLADPAGQAHTSAEIKLLYDTYFGRDPSASDTAAWQNAIVNGGYDFTGMRAFLLADPAGQAHTSVEITLLYDTYFGRDPSASDTAAWQNVIVNGGYDFTKMRAFLLADPAGQAHTNAEIKSLYDTYFGRDPSASDTAAWQNVIVNSGYDFNGMRTFLLNDPAGVAHTDATVKSLFDTYFGRDPTAYEAGVWQKIILGGADFHMLQDALERQSTIIPHLIASAGSQVFNYGTDTNLTIDNFNTALDSVVLSVANFHGINPLDAAHAQQITTLDGTTDVLITLDASHTLLFEHTLLTSLHAGDFIFG